MDGGNSITVHQVVCPPLKYVLKAVHLQNGS